MPFDPRLIEAKIAMERIPSNEIPSIAWDALEAGLDGPAIKRLASLLSPTYFEVRDVLPDAMKEMGLAVITPLDAGIRLAKVLANELLQLSDEDLLCRGHTFEKLYVDLDYPRELQTIGFLDDEIYLARYMGSKDSEVAEMLRKLLKNFLLSIEHQGKVATS
jgi:hypothetical protein